MDGAFPSAQGEPFGDGDEDRRRGFRGNSENAKTKICTRWKSGHCRFGDSCNFAHGDEELRRLPPRTLYPGAGGGRGRGGPGFDSGFSVGYGGPRSGPQPSQGPGPGDFYRGGYSGPAYGGPHQAGPQGAAYSGAVGFDGPRQHEAGGPPSGQQDLWAAQGYPVTGPNGWTQYSTLDTGEPYFHNHRTGETVWDKPAEWR